MILKGWHREAPVTGYRNGQGALDGLSKKEEAIIAGDRGNTVLNRPTN
jgi:hypothetical protein